MSNHDLIHSTAIIDPSAVIAADVQIGPYCVIGPQVTIGAGTKLHSHVVVGGFTRIGQNNEIFQFASVGEVCQDLKYKGEETWLEIGNNNLIREHCSLHRGTVQDNALTKIGSHNLLMVNTHIAHDCIVGDHNILLIMSVSLGMYILVITLLWAGILEFINSARLILTV